MLDKTTVVKVKNRDNGRVGYTIPELHVTRSFMPGEVKEVTMEELRALSYISGGTTLLKDFLVVNNEEAMEELVGEVEPEYYYTEEDVVTLLTEGNLDQLLDCLDFAPAGVIDIVKAKAVELEISDIRKRNAIEKATGLDITQAIAINHESASEDTAETTTKTRRSAPVSSEKKTTTRRYIPVTE